MATILSVSEVFRISASALKDVDAGRSFPFTPVAYLTTNTSFAVVIVCTRIVTSGAISSTYSTRIVYIRSFWMRKAIATDTSGSISSTNIALIISENMASTRYDVASTVYFKFTVVTGESRKTITRAT